MIKVGEYFNLALYSLEMIELQISHYQCKQCNSLPEQPLECPNCTKIYCFNCRKQEQKCVSTECEESKLQKLNKREQQYIKQLWLLISQFKEGEKSSLMEEGKDHDPQSHSNEGLNIVKSEIQVLKSKATEELKVSCAVCFEDVHDSTEDKREHRHECHIERYWCHDCQKLDHKGKIFHLQTCQFESGHLEKCDKCGMKGLTHVEKYGCIDDCKEFFSQLKLQNQENSSSIDAKKAFICCNCDHHFKNSANKKHVCQKSNCQRQYCEKCHYQSLQGCHSCQKVFCCVKTYQVQICQYCYKQTLLILNHQERNILLAPLTALSAQQSQNQTNLQTQSTTQANSGQTARNMPQQQQQQTQQQQTSTQNRQAANQEQPSLTQRPALGFGGSIFGQGRLE